MRNDKLHKIFYIVSMVGIVLATVFIVYVGVLFLWPYKTISFKETENLEIVNEGKKLYPGQDLQYKVSYCKYTDIQAKVTREIHDGIIYIMPTIQTYTGKECKEDVIINIAEIPKAIPTGEYKMFVTLEFKVNPIRTITHTLYTEKFYVVK